MPPARKQQAPHKEVEKRKDIIDAVQLDVRPKGTVANDPDQRVVPAPLRTLGVFATIRWVTVLYRMLDMPHPCTSLHRI